MKRKNKKTNAVSVLLGTSLFVSIALATLGGLYIFNPTTRNFVDTNIPGVVIPVDNSHDAQIAELNSQIATLQTDLIELTDQLSASSEENVTLIAQIATLQANLQTAVAAYDASQITIGELEGQITTLNAQIVDLQTQIAVYEEIISEIQLPSMGFSFLEDSSNPTAIKFNVIDIDADLYIFSIQNSEGTLFSANIPVLESFFEQDFSDFFTAGAYEIKILAIKAGHISREEILFYHVEAQYFEIVVDLADGTDPTTLTIAEGEIFEQSDPIREGYIFSGWEISNGFTFGEVVLSDLTITATWVEITQDISYLRAVPEGTAVTIRGIITGLTTSYIWLQDQNGLSTMVIDQNRIYTTVGNINIEIGDEILVQGEKSTHFDDSIIFHQTQIVDGVESYFLQIDVISKSNNFEITTYDSAEDVDEFAFVEVQATYLAKSVVYFCFQLSNGEYFRVRCVETATTFYPVAGQQYSLKLHAYQRTSCRIFFTIEGNQIDTFGHWFYALNIEDISLISSPIQ